MAFTIFTKPIIRMRLLDLKVFMVEDLFFFEQDLGEAQDSQLVNEDDTLKIGPV